MTPTSIGGAHELAYGLVFGPRDVHGAGCAHVVSVVTAVVVVLILTMITIFLDL